MSKCKIDDCNSTVCARGYCKHHYNKLYAKGYFKRHPKHAVIALVDKHTNEIIDTYASKNLAAKCNNISPLGLDKALRKHDGYMPKLQKQFRLM